VSEVTLQVGGRAYPVSCAEGEEDHVRHLAAVVDGKLAALGANLAPGDAQNLLFAALILADEVEEARRAGDPNYNAETGAASSKLELALAGGLEATADRLEKLARTLENAANNA
jgi:cell division protein ZapA